MTRLQVIASAIADQAVELEQRYFPEPKEQGVIGGPYTIRHRVAVEHLFCRGEIPGSHFEPGMYWRITFGYQLINVRDEVEQERSIWFYSESSASGALTRAANALSKCGAGDINIWLYEPRRKNRRRLAAAKTVDNSL